MEHFYQVKQNEQGDFELHRNGYPVLSFGLQDTAAGMKALCWRELGIVPVRIYSDEVLYDAKQPVHEALARLEARHTPHQVIAVGSTHYSIRRSRFGVEVPVRYKLVDGPDAVGGPHVEARNDMENLA